MNRKPDLRLALSKFLPSRKFLNLALVVISIMLLTCVISFALLVWGGGGEPATLIVASRAGNQFVAAIHNQDIDTAYGMLSEQFPQVSKTEFSKFLLKDEKIFATYQRLDICEWGFFISNGRVITSTGLLYFENGVIVVEMSLHKDTDTIWRVLGFRFRSDMNPVPYGLCQ
jgi:hypothetical protein